MTKIAGLGWRYFLHGYDLSNDIGAFGRIGGGNTPIDRTGIDKLAFERRGGKRDGGMDLMIYFNPAEARAHERFSAPTGPDVLGSVFVGTALGAPAACLVAKQTNYDATRGEAGELDFAASMLANGFGLEWTEQLTPGKRTDAGAADGAGVDFGASTAFGLQAYLHVFEFTGTDATIKLQESDDNGGADPWADVTGGAFTQVTSAPAAERIQTARDLAVKRWLRVVTTGTFSNLVFAVSVAKNVVSTVF